MKRNILVVEDNEDICAILNKRLEINGYRVSFAKSGLSFLSYLKNGAEPDIVILDLVLPDRAGMELLCSLTAKWKKAKVFIFSAHLEYKERIEKYVEGFFVKTDGVDKLINAINSAVKEKG